MHRGVGKSLSRRDSEIFSPKQQAARNIKLAPFGGRSYNNKGSSFGYAVPEKVAESYKADETWQESEALQRRC